MPEQYRPTSQASTVVGNRAQNNNLHNVTLYWRTLRALFLIASIYQLHSRLSRKSTRAQNGLRIDKSGGIELLLDSAYQCLKGYKNASQKKKKSRSTMYKLAKLSSNAAEPARVHAWPRGQQKHWYTKLRKWEREKTNRNMFPWCSSTVLWFLGYKTAQHS